MEDYDNEDAEPTRIAVTAETDLAEEMTMNVASDEEDEEAVDPDAFEEDKEDFELRDTDKLVLVAQTDEDYSCLEVQVYDSETGSLYVHHDIALPAFPLCVSWVGSQSSSFGSNIRSSSKNFAAVGTFSPIIEVWNLDVIDLIDPALQLGGRQTAHGEYQLSESSHTDAIMCLDWNALRPNLLASASADSNVKLWDLSTQAAVFTYSHHKDKVQSVSWNPVEAEILLTGSFDQSLTVFDARQGSSNATTFTVDSDVECAVWNPHLPAQVIASTEDGKVRCFDVRAAGKPPLYELHAHSSACSAVSMSSLVKGMMATCSPDKTVKIWDVFASPAPGALPKLVYERSMNIGAIFDCSLCIDSEFLLAAGGDEGVLAIWDMRNEEAIQAHFQPRVGLAHDLKQQEETQESPGSKPKDELASELEKPSKPKKQKKAKGNKGRKKIQAMAA